MTHIIFKFVSSYGTKFITWLIMNGDNPLPVKSGMITIDFDINSLLNDKERLKYLLLKSTAFSIDEINQINNFNNNNIIIQKLYE